MQHQSLFNKSQWTQLVKRFSAVAVLGLTIAAPAWAIDPTVKELRIGFQKSSINFAIAKQQKLFEQEF
ncbi:aliphatic sulfonate ABC transporter substrate-binding protein, partial [Acinetobacter baumannii]